MLWLIARLNRASPSPKPSQDLTLPVSDETVPQVVFSFPEAASVGLALDDAKSCETIINPQETAYPMLSNSRMLMSGEGGSMTIVSGALAGAPDVPLVLGVHIVSPLASDLIAEAEQLVGNRVPLAAAAGSFTASHLQ